MCGIVGVFNSDGRLPDAQLFSQCLERLRNRGPDDLGVWSDHAVRLGHRRLSVVDLSAAGHQPMQSHDGRYVIVFNGEIYNHAELRPQLTPVGGWRGTSDTETLLEAIVPGASTVCSRLNGMFAFAIWDQLERRLFVARDRDGRQAALLRWRTGAFAFASRPAALAPLCGTGRGRDGSPARCGSTRAGIHSSAVVLLPARAQAARRPLPAGGRSRAESRALLGLSAHRARSGAAAAP